MAEVRLVRPCCRTFLILALCLVGSCGGGGGGDEGGDQTVFVVAGTGFGQTLFRFSLDTPQMVETVGAITLPGFAIIHSLAFRPQDGQLFAFAYNCGLMPPPWPIVLYRIDTATGAATFVAGSSTSSSCQLESGLTFTPSGEGRVTNANEHWTVDLDTGDFTSQAFPAYISGDPNEGATTDPQHLAYDATGQAYVLDQNTEVLARLADLSNPDPGRLSTVGTLGAFLAATDLQSGGGFDISGGRGIAILRTMATGLDRIYEINLATGAATDLGLVGDGLLEIAAMAVQP